MNFLTEIASQHEELESPASFWQWSAIAAISAVLKDQVWLNRQIYNLYPNIYVMLHAESGLKKGPPISMAKQLVKLVNNTRIISGRSSIQGILKEMGTAFTQPGGKVVSKSVAFICSSELSSSIVDDKVATKILTDLYDRQYNVGEWKSLLKMESFELKNPTVTMLTATNEAMSEDFFTRSAIQGGYFARTFIIYEKESKVSNSLVYPLSHPPNYVVSADYLRVVAKLNGEFHAIAQIEKSEEYKFRKIKHGRDVYFNETGIIYDDWYENFKELVKSTEKDETGTLNRFGDSVLKVAMLLSLAYKPELVLAPEAMTDAITECEKLLGNVRKTTMGKQGISQSALLKTTIIMELLNRESHQVTRTILMKKMWQHYAESQEFDDIMQSFQDTGIIITSSVGNQILYTMPPKQVEELKRFMSGKAKKDEDYD
jgi:hypothetical protein